VNAIFRNALAQQIPPPAGLADQQDVRNGIGDQAVDLFRHAAIKAAEPGLNVTYRDMHFCGDHGRRHR